MPEPTFLASEPLGRRLQRRGSSAPVPSGGAASVVAGVPAASLVAMVSELLAIPAAEGSAIVGTRRNAESAAVK